MMKRANWKRLALAGVLLVLLLGISGCLSKPDQVEDLPTPPVDEVLPFPEITPSPSPSPTPEGGWIDHSTGEPAGVITPPPATATIQLMTATPTPIPAWTYSPAPTTPRPTVTATPVPDVLRVGSQGDDVRRIQQRLKDLGYLTGSVDGDFGSATESAVKEFQRVNGLTADGIVGSRTKSTLNSSSAKSKPKATSTPRPTTNSSYATARPTPKSYTPSTPGKYGYLELGSSGRDVTSLQNRLAELGYFHGAINGRYGEDTEAAVRAFQQRNGEWVDGKAGPDTQEAIYSNSALKAPSGSNAVPSSGGYRALALGDAGNDVTLVQTRLKELGYYTEKIDGNYGTTTATAVKLFQQQNGLTVEDVANIGTLARMFSDNALYAATEEEESSRVVIVDTMEAGSFGEDVFRLQERLYDLGYYAGAIDGIYSDAVATAVRAFQTANKLTVDGKAGRSTQRRIYDEAAVAAGTAASETYATLREGDTGERVRALQSLLINYGYYTGASDGLYDAATTTAVQQLQAQNGLFSDGVAGPATLQLLYQGAPKHASAQEEAQTAAAIAPTYEILKSGASGPDVMMLQQFLNELGYYLGEQTGDFDGETLLAVQAFQSRNSLTPDGIAGQETQALLYSGNAVPSEAFGANFLQALAEYATPVPTRATMQAGDEGQDVFTMQERLQLLGYFAEAPNGLYDAATTAAVRTFQEKNGITADGIAGKTTVAAMYAAGVVANFEVNAFVTADNSDREIEEQRRSGAISASLAGGGVAASYNSNIYYAGKGGNLYARSGSSTRQIYDGKASFIHASDKGITFVSGNKIMRVSASGSNKQTLATVGGIKKLTVLGDTLIYLDGSSLVKVSGQADPVVLAKGVKDFSLDVFMNMAYLATGEGVRNVALNGGGGDLLSSTPADQVQVVEDVIYFRGGKTIYRIQDGVTVLFLDDNATWMGVYRDHLYYISGGNLYRVGTDGSNNRLFYDGTTAGVSFVAGKVYITARTGGEVTEIIDVDM